MTGYKLVPSKSFLKDLAKLPDEIGSKAAKALLELKTIHIPVETLRS